MVDGVYYKSEDSIALSISLLLDVCGLPSTESPAHNWLVQQLTIARNSEDIARGGFCYVFVVRKVRVIEECWTLLLNTTLGYWWIEYEGSLITQC